MLLGIQGSGQLTDRPPDPGRFRAVAELAEELGYDSIWAGEHLSFHNPILDLGVALAAFAAVTERVLLGAGIVLLPLRHPSLVAKQAASLDYLSGGRLVLGVGVGGEGAKDFEAAGVDVRERGARADEGIAALRALFAPGPASFAGRFHRFDGVEIAPRSPRAERAADPRRRSQRGSAAPCRTPRGRLAPIPGLAATVRRRARERARARVRRRPRSRRALARARRVRTRRRGRPPGARGDTRAPVAALPDALRAVPRRAPLHRGHAGGVRRAPGRVRGGRRRRTSRSTRPRTTTCSSRWSGCARSASWRGQGSRDASARRRPDPLGGAVRRRAVGDAATRGPRRGDREDRGSRLGRRRRPLRAAVSRRARTPSSSRRSTAARRASRSTCAIPARDASSHDLVRVSDGRLLEPARRPAAASSALTYEQLRDVNPRIVCCSLSGFGMTGPRAAEGGYDYMMQGLAGWQSLTGEPGGPPTKSGLSLVDLSGGYASAIALLAGIWRARRDGVGCDCDVSLFETALHELMYIGPWAATHGYVPAPPAELGPPVDRPVPELRRRRRLVRRRRRQAGASGSGSATSIGLSELKRTSASQRVAARERHRDELLPILEEAFRTRPADDWVESLVDAGVPAVAREHASRRRSPTRRRSRGRTSSSTTIRRSARVRSIRTPLRLSQDGEQPRERAGARSLQGEHTEELPRDALRLQPRARRRARGRRRLREGGAREPRSRRLRQHPPDPRWPGGARTRRSASCSTTRKAARTRRSRATPPPRRSCTRSSGAPPTVGRAQPEHRVDVRVRQPRRLLARSIASSPRTACR